MKLAAIIAALFLAIGCAGSPKAGSGNDGLDAGMRKISDYLNERIPKGNKVVFLNVKSDWPDLSEYILSGLSENAVNDRVFSVVDRQQLDSIRAELNFQWSGEVSDKSAQEIGQMLGAQIIVSGVVTKIGDEYRIQVRAITVKTAEVQGQTTQMIDGKGKRVVALTKKVVPAGSGGASSGTSTASGTRTQTATGSGQSAQAAPAQPATVYKIGDTGPAGGLIFYDKGNSIGGWRYLEAAPADINDKFQNYMDGVPPNDFRERAVGWGKRNTAAIMKEAASRGGGFGWPAQACDTYTLNGFNDWFLPSLDELNWVYGNLHKKGLGDFRNDWYVSSTDNPVMLINFRTGEQDFWHGNRINNQRVRLIRQF